MNDEGDRRCYIVINTVWDVGISYVEQIRISIYMQHNPKPKYIIQNIDWGALNTRHDFYGYEQFMPYANDSLVREFTGNLIGSFTFAERHFPLFIYNSHSSLIFNGIKSYFSKEIKSNNYKGYKANTGKWDNSFEKAKVESKEDFRFYTNDSAIREFNSYLDYCRENSIKVIFVYAPTYYEATMLMDNKPEMEKLYIEISKKYNIPILDYSHDSLCYDKKNFFNSQHLNSYGADFFSQKLGDDLKQYIHIP